MHFTGFEPVDHNLSVKMRICDFFKTTANLSYGQNVDPSVTTPTFILTCSSRALYGRYTVHKLVLLVQLSGSRLPIQHSHTKLQVTLILK